MTSARQLALALAAVLASAFLVYSNSFPSELIWDDVPFVENNYFLKDCRHLGAALNPVYLFRTLPVPMRGRPALNASILLDTCLGAGAAGMRRTNIAIHAANSALVFTAAYALTQATVPALIAGLMFALHPAAAEPVSVVTFRSQLLCAFFYLCALLSALLYLRSRRTAALAFSVLSFLAAMLSNEAGITFPLAFALLCLVVEKPSGLRRELALFFSLCAAAALFYLWFRLPRGSYDIPGLRPFGSWLPDFLRHGAAPGPAAAAAPGESMTYTMHIRLAGPAGPPALHPAAPPWNAVYFSWKLRLLTMAGILGGYLKTLLLPLGLQLDYNPPVLRNLAQALPALLGLTGAALAAWLLRNKKPLAAFGLMFIFISLLPVMNLVPIYNIKADRYLYLALAGLALAAAGLAASAGASYRRAPAAAFLCCALALGAATYARNPSLRSNFEAFYSITRGEPAVPRAEINMAREYARRKDAAGVTEHLRRSLAVQENPGVRELLESIEKTGRLPEAEIIR